MPDFETSKVIVNVTRPLSGRVDVPAGKSEIIRAVFCAALCEGESRINGVYLSDDVSAALRCAESLGAVWRNDGDSVLISGRVNPPEPVFDCGEAASVLRFAIPAAMALCGGGTFIGHGRLMARPLEPYFELFDQWGTEYELNENTLVVKGKFPSGSHRVSGSMSSQFVSGVLMALPLVGGGEVYAENGLNSSGYADMTCDVMRRAGACVSRTGDRFTVSGEYAPFVIDCVGDWSQAAFWYAANHLGADITIGNLKNNSNQPDEKIRELSSMMIKTGELCLDLSDNPDLLPPLALMASVRDGGCVFFGCERLKYKESNRLESVVCTLKKLGADIDPDGEKILVRGKQKLCGGAADSFGDHRIAMMAAVAAITCENPVEITGADSVNKSYPDFFREFERLGGHGCVSISGNKTEN